MIFYSKMGKCYISSVLGSIIVIFVLITGSERLVEAQAQCNCTPLPKACEVRVRTDAGWVCGRVRAAEDGTRYASFRGVPYAKPPLGDRRFKELEPPVPWDHFLDSTEDGPVCPQKDYIYNRIPLQLKGMSEDCIYLNLHIPHDALRNSYSDDPQNRTISPGLPILVFVHGGAFHAGSGLTDLHGPEYLMTKPVIVITFNFRIGVFGFLSLNTPKIPGNQGLRDIITLLRWVQRNARAFGGDPRNVTLMGHSTGASLAHLVSLSPAVKGLIHRVILMSGTAVPNYFTASPAQAKSVADTFLGVLGINSTDPNEVHDRLVKEPILNIMNAYNVFQLNSKFIILSLVPVVESEFPNVTRILDDDPLSLIAKGRGKEYPLIVGFTTAEFYFFKWTVIGSNIIETAKEDATILLPARMRYNLAQETQTQLADEIKRKYLGTQSLENIINTYSDTYFVYPAMKVVEWRRAIGGAPVYMYQFSYESLRNVIKEATWTTYRGVAHVEDLTFVFRVNSMLGNYVSYPPKNKDDLMKQWMTKVITNFMQCSNPTCTKDESEWPQLSGDYIQYQDFAEPMVYQMRNLTLQQKEMVRFLDSIDAECRDVADRIKHLKNKTHK